MKKNTLFITPKRLATPRIRLFLFPYAGGSIATYMPWAKIFNADSGVELVLVQFPARGSRMSEHAHQTMASLIAELIEHSSYITSCPYILFGHSLGGKIAYELTCNLKQLGLPSPLYLVASGSRAPHLSSTHKCIHNLPKNEFLSELEQLNGTPKEILSNNDLLDILLPLLRADFKIAEEYVAEAYVIDCPILVLGGTDDTEISLSQLEAWGDISRSSTTIQFISGDHFFIDQNANSVVQELQSLIKKLGVN